MTLNDHPDEVTRAVESLPEPPLSDRDLRGVGPGPSGVVAVPDDSTDTPRVRLYLSDADVVARFEADAGEWTVETVASPDERH